MLSPHLWHLNCMLHIIRQIFKISNPIVRLCFIITFTRFNFLIIIIHHVHFSLFQIMRCLKRIIVPIFFWEFRILCFIGSLNYNWFFLIFSNWIKCHMRAFLLAFFLLVYSEVMHEWISLSLFFQTFSFFLFF